MFQTAKIISLNRLFYRCYKNRNIIKFQCHQFSLLRIKINTISSVLIKGLVSQKSFSGNSSYNIAQRRSSLKVEEI